MQNKELQDNNQNLGINPSSHQNNLYNQMKYQNINPNYKNSYIPNNLINAEFEYPQDYQNQNINNAYLQHNNFINKNKDIKPNNNLINNNLIYQDYNQPNFYNDPKRQKQEEYRRILDQQRIQDLERKEKIREIPNMQNNNNFRNNNINDNTNKIITRPQMNEEEKAKHRKKQMEYNEILRKQIEEKNKTK